MYIDFIINSTDINESEVKDILVKAIRYPISSITVPYHFLKIAKAIVGPNSSVALSCLVDYPLGLSDIKTRSFAVDQLNKSGVNHIDISMPQNLASNRKYDKIREDIKNIALSCANIGAEPRYMLEYRIFDHHCLKKICEILDDFNIKYVYPSSGFFLDNLADNILASIFLHENSKNINIICTGNMWMTKHFETMTKSGLFGFRTSSISSLENFASKRE